MGWLRCLIAAAVLGTCLGNYEKLLVKYGVPSLDPLHVDCFFELQRTRSEAEKDGWAMAEDRIPTDGYAILCRNKDYRICLLFDTQGSIAGVQVSISVEDVERSLNPYPMDLIAMQQKKRILGTDIYAATVLFVDDGVLKSGGRTLTEDTKTAPNGMYFLLRDGEKRFVPASTEDLEGTLYRRQGCKDAMGRHYFYNMTSDLGCEELEAFSPIYDDSTGDLVAVTYLAFGRSSTQKYGRRWYEYPTGPGFKVTAPDCNECYPKWIDTYGMIAFHIYIHNEPWTIRCVEN